MLVSAFRPGQVIRFASGGRTPFTTVSEVRRTTDGLVVLRFSDGHGSWTTAPLLPTRRVAATLVGGTAPTTTSPTPVGE